MSLLCFVVLSLSFGLQNLVIAQNSDPTFPLDKEVLQDLFKKANGRNWRNKTGWYPGNGDPCKDGWFGVACTDQGRVSGIHLQSNHLVGKLTPRIGELEFLQGLWLGSSDVSGVNRNYLMGSIPPEVSLLQRLTHLDLSYNSFTGSIPASFTNITTLRYLDLSHNRMTGEVGDSLSNLLKLVTLLMRDNKFRGSLNFTSTLPELRKLDVSYNLFNGTMAPLAVSAPHARAVYAEGNPSLKLLSAGLSTRTHDMQALATLSQDVDALTALYHSTSGSLYWALKRGWDNAGSDPCLSKWYGVTCSDTNRVIGLSLSRNNLTGFLPDAITQLTALVSLDLSENRLRGGLPSGMNVLTSLRRLDVRGNFLQGSLALDGMDSLEHLDVSYNAFTGTLPAGLASSKELRSIDMSRNRFVGELPASWGNLKVLGSADVSRNRLTGALPPEWSAASSLKLLSAHSNGISGSLPSSWAQMRRLQTLDLHGCKLEGSLPRSWSGMAALVDVDLSNNALEGDLPPSWSQLALLVNFKLADNMLSGQIPLEWGQLNKTIKALVLRNNNITGPLPGFLDSFHTLASLDLSYNRLSGFLPDFLLSASWVRNQHALNLRNNEFNCPVPPDLPLTVATCSSSSCPRHWVSTGARCIPCRPGFGRVTPMPRCSRCMQPEVTETTPQGPVTGSPCAVTLGDTTHKSVPAVKCRPCQLVDLTKEEIIPDESDESVSTRDREEPLSGRGELLFDQNPVFGKAAVYNGDWYGGYPHGNGTLKGRFGSYLGGFRYGKMNNLGKLKTARGDVMVGEYGEGGRWWPGERPLWSGRLNGDGVLRNKSSLETFEGQFVGGRFQGFGSLISANGDTFAGQFRDGVKDGIGIMEYHYGGRYEGYWSNDQRNGYGSMKWPNGDIYEGTWRQGLQHGNGTMWTFTGKIYDGEWEDGSRSGHGRLIDKRLGDVYVGDFKADEFNGFGVLHYGNGDAHHGQWRDGKRHGDAVIHFTDKDGTLSSRRGAGRQLKASFMFDTARTMLLPETVNQTTIGTTSSEATVMVPSQQQNTSDTNAYMWTGN